MNSHADAVRQTTTTTLPRRVGAAGSYVADAWTWLRSLVAHHPLPFLAAGAGITARAVFWGMTDRRFEDGLITVTHARNAVEGLGLTHHPGEPHTQGFTSALSLLVPLVGEEFHRGSGFLALRLSSLVAFAATIAAAYAIGLRLGVSRWPMLFPLAYLAFDENQIFYGMSGMETQIATAILLGGAYFLMRGSVIMTGVLLGLALLARPDFVLWVVPALLYLAYVRRRSSLVATGVATAVVLPWIIFTTLYYGSPEPNTIKAKALRYPLEFPGVEHLRAVGSWLWDHIADGYAIWHAFTPLLENGFVIDTPFPNFFLTNVAFVFMVLATIGLWASRRVPGWPPLAAFAVLFLVYRIYLLPPIYYEWYMGPFMAVVAIASGAGLESLRRLAPRAIAVTAVVLAGLFAMHMPITFPLEADVQHKIEDKVRMPMAEYLNSVVPRGARVTSESAGYVGYYSHVELWDYPGLTSPGALAVMEKLGIHHNSLLELINAAHPEWIVMRPYELEGLKTIFPDAAALYEPVREFSVPYGSSPLRRWGVAYVNIDRDFIVLKRRGAGAL